MNVREETLVEQDIPMLELRSLTFDWQGRGGSRALLRAISLRIRKTDRIAVLGHTGSGKSTLAQLICARIRPHSGQYRYEGRECGYALYKKKLRLQYQILPQHPLQGFNPCLSLDNSLNEARRALAGRTETEFLALKEELCARVNIAPSLLSRYPHEVSGGQLQRAALVRAFSAKPRFIVLDEPISFLDLSLRKQILDLLLELHSRYKIAVLLISHLPEVQRYFSNSQYVLEEGQLSRVHS